jgi:hypothetical protein
MIAESQISLDHENSDEFQGVESAETEVIPPHHTDEPSAEREKGDRKEPVKRGRDAGKSLLPMARVQRIIKADKVCVVAFTEDAVVANVCAPVGHSDGHQRSHLCSRVGHRGIHQTII